MTYSRKMLTRDQLAELLGSVNVEELSREADVSTKTIYRLRHRMHAPTLDTVAKLLDAVKKMQRKSRRAVA